MISGRCAFIVIYFALSALNPISARAAFNLGNVAATRERIVPRPESVNQPQSVLSSITQPESESNPALFKQSPNSLEKSNLAVVGDLADSKSIEARERYLALGAMALTFSIALFLLWLLFRKPSSSERKIGTVVAEQNSASTGETAKDNLAVDRAIASSALDLEPNQSATQAQPQSSTVADVDVVVRAVRDLQSEVDFNHNLSDSDPVARITRRREAIWELTEIGDYRSIEPLLKIMPDAEEPDKSFIIAAVTKIINRSFRPIDDRLFANLQNEDPKVRLNAIRDLRNLYQFVTPVITKISQMQSDADYEVRQTAIQALRQLNADPFPTFSKAAKTPREPKTDNLVSGAESEANLHLVAYLLAELDAEKQC